MRRSPAGRILITKVGISSKQAKTFAFLIEAFEPFISCYMQPMICSLEKMLITFSEKNDEFEKLQIRYRF